MVKDRTNYYYTKLLGGLQELYMGMDGSQEINGSPPSFPYMNFFQINGEGAIGTLSGTEDGINLAYEVRFYSRTSPNDVREIANSARAIMIEKLDFQCAYFRSMENVKDKTIYQFITRFAKLET